MTHKMRGSDHIYIDISFLVGVGSGTLVFTLTQANVNGMTEEIKYWNSTKKEKMNHINTIKGELIASDNMKTKWLLYSYYTATMIGHMCRHIL
jgi:hypothetical protein